MLSAWIILMLFIGLIITMITWGVVVVTYFITGLYSIGIQGILFAIAFVAFIIMINRI